MVLSALAVWCVSLLCFWLGRHEGLWFLYSMQAAGVFCAWIITGEWR